MIKKIFIVFSFIFFILLSVQLYLDDQNTIELFIVREIKERLPLFDSQVEKEFRLNENFQDLSLELDQTVFSHRDKIKCLAGNIFYLPILFKNFSSFIIKSYPEYDEQWAHSVSMSYQFEALFSNERGSLHEPIRTPFVQAVLPKASPYSSRVLQAIKVKCPDQVGLYQLSISLVQEGIAWYHKLTDRYPKLRVEVSEPKLSKMPEMSYDLSALTGQQFRILKNGRELKVSPFLFELLTQAQSQFSNWNQVFDVLLIRDLVFDYRKIENFEKAGHWLELFTSYDFSELSERSNYLFNLYMMDLLARKKIDFDWFRIWGRNYRVIKANVEQLIEKNGVCRAAQFAFNQIAETENQKARSELEQLQSKAYMLLIKNRERVETELCQ